MSENFDGMDFEVPTTSSTFGKFILGAMLVAFSLASMITTFSFFVTYAPGLGEVLHAEYGPYIAGALGVMLFDLAGLGWTVLRARNSETSPQFVIATLAAVVTIGLALLTSALQVLLSSAFDVGLYDAGGGLSQFGQAMQITGVVVMTAGFVLNFAAIAAYVNTSKGVAKAVQDTQLRAYMTQGQFVADKARAELVMGQTLENILHQLPQYAAQAGRSNSAHYVNRSFTGMLNGQQQPPAANGHQAASRLQATSPGGPEEIAQLRAMLAAYDAAGDDDGGAMDLDALVDMLVEERMRERLAAAPAPSGNGNGANFTPRPGNGRAQ